ncbi:MAG: gliding motility-associated C-terminal domain-containing protein, partial [Bacteroidia bacterium]|nr:gliding motility-associated C-terminal domain-containing protein [Bacteroidia bacterium]
PNQTVCITSPTATLAANTPTTGTGTWSVLTGGGVVTSSTNPNTTVTGLTLGTNILEWTITSAGTCSSTSSTMTIVVDPATSIANAGLNQTVCITSPTATLAANTPTTGTGTWSVLTGGGVVTSSTNPNTTVTGLTLGTNVLQWSITSAGTCSSTSSTMTIVVDPATSIANAGANQTVCISSPTATLAANTPTTGTGTWSVLTGGGVVTSSTNPNSTVTGLTLGTNILEWTITSAGTCSSTSSTMTIVVDPLPSIALAGPNQTVCVLNPTTILAANTPTSGVGTWSVISGSATIANVNNPTTTLTAVGLGTNVLQWTINNGGVCPQTVSTMTVFVDPAPSIALAGPNQTLCVLNPTTTLAANTPTSGVGTWSVILGSATIANVNNPTTTLTAVGLGTNVLQWTITNNGACPQTVSTKTIFVDPAPSVAMAGPNQTLCILNPSTTLAGNTPTSGVGTWAVIIGSAIITSPNNPSTTVTSVGQGINVLQWSITNNGACPQTVSTMVIQVDPAPSIAIAGSNQTLCILNPTTALAANTPTSGVGTWSVISGSAIISNVNNPSTTLTAVGLGTNVLQWTITNNGACPQTVSTMTIFVDPAPSIALAGPNQTLCVLNPTTTLAANTPTSGVGTWSVISGSATIANVNNPTTTLTAVGLGTNVLQWTINNGGACPQTVSTMTVFVDPAPSIALAGPNQTLCVLNPTTILAANTPTSGVGTWSVISGSATIANVNNPTTTLTAVGLGTNVLQWTINNGGVCPQTVSTMTIFVDPAPSIALAGPNQTLCVLNPTTTLAANTPTSGVGTWSVISGSATISNVNNPSTTLTAVGLGTNVLQWTITNNGACPQTVSTMTVFVDPAPSIALAGPNQTLCVLNPTTTLAANTPTSGVGTWSVISGSATVANVNNPTTTLAAVGLGTNVLQWTITNNGACPQTVSTMTVFVDPAPSIALAGSNQTLCISNPTTVLAGNTPTSGVGTWSVISGSATIANVNNPTTTLTAVGLGTNVLQWTINNNGACPQTVSTMTVFVDPAPSIALAGPNQTLCVLNPTTTLAANTPTSGVGTWSVILGSATISNVNNPTTTLTAVALGTNVLQWTITNNGTCPQTVSTMTVFVDQAPSMALAGSNQTVCILTPSATLAANTPTSGTGTWSVISGSGTFNNANNPTTTVSGLSLGTNILQWSITNGGACPQTVSTMVIQVDPAPSIALAGPNQTLCVLNPTTTLAANTPTSGVGTWSVISGSATIANINNPTTTLTAVGLGTNVLQWTINNGGVCPQTVSTMTVFVDPAPSIALAGSNQTLCVLNPTTTLAGNTPTSGVGTWSVISGSATISNVNNPSTTLTAVGLGTNVLQWTITNNGACPQTVSTMTVFVDPAPSIALAGPNQTLCVLNPTTTLAGNTPTSGVGTWSVISGSATIGNINNPTTSLTTVGLGTNVLQWSITNNGACPQTVSTMTIIVDPAPSISTAGPNQTVCISSPNATLAANTPTTGVGTWSVISGLGTITSPNSPTSTVTGLALGINILQWSISNGVCATTTSTMSIQVDNLPTVASAGPSQTLCISSPSLTMAGNIPSVGTGSWSIVLGSATITTPTSGTTTATNLGLGQNIFLWTISNGVCNSSSSSVVITIDPLPSIAVAGSNQTVCISSPSATVNGNAPAVGTGTWSVASGSGTITSVNSPTTTVTNLGLGTNVLQWSIGTVGCAPTISTLSIKVDQLPTIASAGPNQTLCINNPTTTLNANTPIVGAGTWSIMQGGGVLTNSSSPNSSITGMPTGTTVLQWSITNGVCAPSISTMSIQVDNNTIVASAGPNQTLCAASPSTTLAGNTPTVGVGTWVILVGSGSIATPSLANTTVTNLGVGTNILQWTIVNGVCAFNSSVVYIYVVPSPGNPNAGPSQTLCISNPTTTIAANTPSLGTASWSVVSGSANIVSPTTSTSNVLSVAPGNNVLAWTMTYSVCSLTSTLNLHVDLIPSAPVAGPNQTVCISSPTAVLAANTPTSGAGTWSVISGSGTITTPTLATSSVTGLGLGVNVLQWTINGGGCGTNSSTMSIQVDNIPTTAVAGPSQTLCISNPTTVLAGNTPATGIGTWSVIAGSGTISNPNSPTSTITGLGLGLNTLEWTIANGICSSTSTLNIQVDNVPTIANAGSSQSICISTPTFALTGNTPLVGTGTWSVISGSGTITTPTLATSSVTGLGAGLNILEWTIVNGVCGASSSTMSIQVDLAPTIANAGANQALCISSPTTTLAGNAATAGIGTWSITSGSGVITNSLLANSTVTNLALGLNILEWSITSGVCGTTTSTMSIQIDNIPTVSNAGSNQTLCINSPTYTLAGNTPLIGTGTWSIIAGSGTIATPTLANSAVTGLAAGVNVLEWTIANGACGSSTSTMSIQVDQLPTAAIASSNQTICITNPTTTVIGNVPTVGTGIWTLFSGTGAITSATSATTTLTGLGVGTNVFEWTISNGSCVSSVSSVTIAVDPAPTIANAGPNQTICISSGSVLMAANNAAIGTGSWSVVSGSGTFANVNLETTNVTGFALGNNIYAWTIFSGCGSTTSTVSIFVDQVPTTAVAGSNQTICISSPSTTLNGNSPVVGTGIWTLASGSGTITSPNTAVTTVTNIGTGTNVFDWTISNGSCLSSVSSITITVDPAPTIANAGPNQTICISSGSALMAANNAAVGTGSWSVVSGSGTFANVNLETTNVTGFALGNNIYAWTIFSGCGSTTSTVSVFVDQIPTIATASANQTICVGNPTATINGNVPTIGTGIWTLVSGTGTITSPGSAVTTVTNLAIGDNVFEWSISNGVCAPSVATVTITVDPPAIPANAGPNQTVCVSSGAVMAANPPAVGTGTWSVISGSGTFANINLETTNVTGLTVGTNVFAWTISSTCGSSTSNVTITVDQIPTTAIVSANQTICINSPTASINGNVPTVGTGTWTLVSGSGTITTPGNAVTTVTNLAIGVNIFEWSISNGVCAPSTAQVQITVDPLPTTAVAGLNQTVCISSGVTMAANTAAVGTGSWSVVSGSGTFANINLETTSVSGLAIGTNVYAWTIFSNCGSSTSNVTITVHQVPTTATAVSDQTICAGTPTAAITGNVPGVGTGTWTLVSGSGTIVSPGTAATTVTNLAIGINIFEWSISNGVCAPSTASVQITVDPMPTLPVAGANQTICAASTVTMNANVPAIGTGSWTVVSGSGVIASTTLANTSISGLGAGTNVFAWTISNNCSSSTSTVAVIINPTSSIANAGPDQNLCGNTTATLSGNIPAVGTGTWSVISGGASVTSPNVNNSTVTGLTTGTNIMVWTIANGSCPATNDTVKIIIDVPTIANAGADQSTCSNSITLNGNTPLVGTGIWTVIGGSATVITPTLNSSAVTGLSTPTNVFVWTITNGVCPVSTDTVVITIVAPAAPANAGNDTTVFANQVTLNGNNPAPGAGVWTLITGSGNIISSSNYNTLVNSLSPGLNTFQWTITDGCGSTSDQVNITLIDVELPNAISPNGDGKNDYFEIPFIGSYNKVEIKIINRWGNLVYENVNYNNNWNGFNQSGNPLAEDTYFYVLKLDDLVRTGYITIKR